MSAFITADKYMIMRVIIKGWTLGWGLGNTNSSNWGRMITPPEPCILYPARWLYQAEQRKNPKAQNSENYQQHHNHYFLPRSPLLAMYLYNWTERMTIKAPEDSLISRFIETITDNLTPMSSFSLHKFGKHLILQLLQQLQLYGKANKQLRHNR